MLSKTELFLYVFLILCLSFVLLAGLCYDPAAGKTNTFTIEFKVVYPKGVDNGR